MKSYEKNLPGLSLSTVVNQADGWYRIAPSFNESLSLDIDSASINSTANVQLWDYVGVPQQKFYIQYNENGFYLIRSGNCNMYLDVEGGNPNDGTNVWQYSYNGSGTQLWRFISAENNTVWIESKVRENLVLDVCSSQVEAGSNVQVWTKQNVPWHKWKLIPVDAPPPAVIIPEDGWYRIATSFNNNLGLDIDSAATNSTANVQLWDYVGVPQQKFLLQLREDKYFSIKSGNCDMYIDVEGGNPNDGTNVWQYSYNGSGTQLWRFLIDDTGLIWIESKVRSNLVMDVCSNQVGAGSNVQVWTRQNVPWHKWKLEKVEAPNSSQNITNQMVRDKIIQVMYGGRSGRMSCDFDGYSDHTKRHEGIDFVCYKGAPVYSLINGEVIASRYQNNLSTLAVYDSTNNKTVVYLHTANIQVNTGQNVVRGQLLAYEDEKGQNITGPHTHVEVRSGYKTSAAISSDNILSNENPYSYWKKSLF